MSGETYYRVSDTGHGIAAYTVAGAPRRERARARRAVVKALRAHSDVVGRALELAGGDPRRLEVHPDGSITVRNRPRP